MSDRADRADRARKADRGDLTVGGADRSCAGRRPFHVCFVCTGNICRSPMAAAVFRDRLIDAGLDGLVEVGSAGTGSWHVGDSADRRAAAVLTAAGYDCAHTARQFRAHWFDRLDLVIALDQGHLTDLRALAPTPEDAGKVRLFRSYDSSSAGQDLDVPDPYYGPAEGFEECLTMVESAAEGLLEAVREAVAERGGGRRHGGVGK